MNSNIQEKLKLTKLLALDFDGTLTLGAYVVFQEDGKESVVCSRRDSLGVDLLKKEGIEVVVISKETNSVVEKRCNKMSIKCFFGVDNGKSKLDILESYATENGIGQNEIVYMGDDVTDIPSIEFAGVGATVADAHNKCKEVADYTTKNRGGDGAVREICEMILNSQDKKLNY